MYKERLEIMDKLLEVNNITFSIGTGGRRVLATGVLQEGGILNVCGPSGSGKTTLLRILARLRGPDEGQVFLRGKGWHDFTPSRWRRTVHYLAQKPVIFDGTVLANLKRPFELAAVTSDLKFNPEKALELMKRLLLPPELINQDARTLSGGESSRLALVRTILVEPDVLLLDEPIAALDPRAASAVLRLIAEWPREVGGRGVVLVSHIGELAKLPCLSVLDLEATEVLEPETKKDNPAGKEGDGVE